DSSRRRREPRVVDRDGGRRLRGAARGHAPARARAACHARAAGLAAPERVQPAGGSAVARLRIPRPGRPPRRRPRHRHRDGPHSVQARGCRHVPRARPGRRRRERARPRCRRLCDAASGTHVILARDWAETNQRDLVRALDRVRLLLEAHATRGVAAAAPAEAPDEPASADGSPPLALVTLVRLFGLSAFECDVVLLCAGVELDARFAAAVAAAQGAPQERREPTFALALAALPGAHWSALTPGGPLRAWRLVELRGAGLTGAPLRLEERILHFLAGLNQLDERLQGLVTLGAGGGEAHTPPQEMAAPLPSYPPPNPPPPHVSAPHPSA